MPSIQPQLSSSQPRDAVWYDPLSRQVIAASPTVIPIHLWLVVRIPNNGPALNYSMQLSLRSLLPHHKNAMDRRPPLFPQKPNTHTTSLAAFLLYSTRCGRAMTQRLVQV